MSNEGQNRGNRRDFRRIGRKALSSGRTLVLLEARVSPPKKPKFSYVFKRWHLAIPAVIILVIAGVFGGQAYMHSQAIAKQKAAAAAENARARSVSQKAEACRKAKMQEKAASIGKLTYDQLYDNGACDF